MLTLLGLGFLGALSTGAAAKFGLVQFDKEFKIPGTNRTLHVQFTPEHPVRVDLE